MCWTSPGWTLGLRSTLMVEVLERVLGTLELALGLVLEVEHPMYRLLLPL